MRVGWGVGGGGLDESMISTFIIFLPFLYKKHIHIAFVGWFFFFNLPVSFVQGAPTLHKKKRNYVQYSAQKKSIITISDIYITMSYSVCTLCKYK